MNENMKHPLRILAERSVKEQEQSFKKLAEDAERYAKMTDAEKKKHMDELEKAQAELAAEYRENEKNSMKKKQYGNREIRNGILLWLN